MSIEVGLVLLPVYFAITEKPSVIHETMTHIALRCCFIHLQETGDTSGSQRLQTARSNRAFYLENSLMVLIAGGAVLQCVVC